MSEFLYYLNPEHLLTWLQTMPVLLLAAALFLIIFAESGLFFGFFLPGDSFLFTAGIFVAQQKLPIDLPALLAIFFVAAVLGDSVGYWFGQHFGRGFFSKSDSIWRDPHHLEKAEQFYAKHGKKTIIIARFVPIVRTFAPIAAGISSMHYQTFILYNFIGAVLWSIGVTVLGYLLGSVIPSIDRYLIPLIILIVILSVAQPIIHILKDPTDRRQLLRALRLQRGSGG